MCGRMIIKYGGDCMCGFVVFVGAKVVKVGV